MPVLDLVKYPDERLRIKSQNVVVDDSIKSFCIDLVDSLHAHCGVGLAAIQVGQPYRIFVLSDGRPRVFINPEVIEASGYQTMQEGCLSFPGVYAKVERPLRVLAQALDMDGAEFRYEATGLMAVAFMHELDHCDAILFVDRLSHLKRQMVLKKIKR